MKIVTTPITLQELQTMAKNIFGNLVKAVVDIDKQIMAVDGELHADEEKYLIENGSRQSDLWGINLYPQLTKKDFIEYDSMINLRPTQNNFTRGITDPKIRKQITQIVKKLVKAWTLLQ